jgi:trans-2,3-dihydro-3-hydroxyanthranilate isomerase
MARYPFMQVDAFTNQRLAGNPCAILFDTDGLDDATMLAVARENNLSETAFVRRSAVADFGVRYFTPAEEIPLAGHPTIATVFALAETGRLPLTGDHQALTLELRDGPIAVEVFARDGRVTQVVMTQRKPQFLRTYTADEVMLALGLTAADARPNCVIQTVSTGTQQLMVPVRDLAALRRACLVPDAYVALKARGDWFCPHLFVLPGLTAGAQTFARDFSLPPDVMEDPFTGSATGAMAAYLWRYGLLASPRFVAEQGHWMERPGQANVEVIGPRDDIQAVKVGGAAITVLRGEMEF